MEQTTKGKEKFNRDYSVTIAGYTYICVRIGKLGKKFDEPETCMHCVQLYMLTK